ncbi:MAG: acetyl-CoA carboxylase biotin carboxyl carrier protein [Rhodothermales bacterium]
MNLSKIKDLLRIVAESGVAEVEIEEQDFKLVVRKSVPTVTLQQAQAPPVPYYQPVPYPPSMPYPAPVPYASGMPPGAAPPAPAAPAPPAAAPPAPAEASPSAKPSPSASESNGAAAPGASETIVRAPIVGTFYNSPSPEAGPFVESGDTVKVGDVLCIIEAMKLMNEIESEISGTIKKVLVENAQPVEYDQPLFVIAE